MTDKILERVLAEWDLLPRKINGKEFDYLMYHSEARQTTEKVCRVYAKKAIAREVIKVLDEILLAVYPSGDIPYGLLDKIRARYLKEAQ